MFGTSRLPSRDRFVSLLYYLGLLTLGDRPPGSAIERLEIPNRVIRELQWEYLTRESREQDHVTLDTEDMKSALRAMAIEGDIQPLHRPLPGAGRQGDGPQGSPAG